MAKEIQVYARVDVLGRDGEPLSYISTNGIVVEDSANQQCVMQEESVPEDTSGIVAPTGGSVAVYLAMKNISARATLYMSNSAIGDYDEDSMFVLYPGEVMMMFIPSSVSLHVRSRNGIGIMRYIAAITETT